MIPINAAHVSVPGAIVRSLITQYGDVTLPMIEAYDATFMGQNVRQAQDNRLASLALMNSLTPSCRRSIRLQSSLYVVNGEPSANKLLRTIIQTSHVDTQATSATIRERLSNLDAAMAKYQNNVVHFNEYVVEQVDTLASRGETSSDVLVNLLRAKCISCCTV